MTDKYEKTDLNSAYSLQTAEDSKQLYRAWADSYDDTFAAQMSYIAPDKIAELYLSHGSAEDAPIVDIGCGTGLVGAALDAKRLDGWAIDGIDISAEMLAQARKTGAYRLLLSADLLQPLALETASYGGVISAGAFTHGHIGPEPLEELTRIARPASLFVLGINAKHFHARGFKTAFERLEVEGRISPVEIVDLPIYGEDAAHEHKNERAAAAVFRRR